MIDLERLRSLFLFRTCFLLGEIDSPMTSMSPSESSDKSADSNLDERA